MSAGEEDRDELEVLRAGIWKRVQMLRDPERNLLVSLDASPPAGTLLARAVERGKVSPERVDLLQALARLRWLRDALPEGWTRSAVDFWAGLATILWDGFYRLRPSRRIEDRIRSNTEGVMVDLTTGGFDPDRDAFETVAARFREVAEAAREAEAVVEGSGFRWDWTSGELHRVGKGGRPGKAGPLLRELVEALLLEDDATPPGPEVREALALELAPYFGRLETGKGSPLFNAVEAVQRQREALRQGGRKPPD